MSSAAPARSLTSPTSISISAGPAFLTMPRRVPIDEHREQIVDAAQSGKSSAAIRVVILNDHGIDVSSRTINNRLHEWGIRPAPAPAVTSQDIDNLVLELLRKKTKTKKILEILAQRGIPSSERTLRRTRKRLGIRLRRTAQEMAEDAEREQKQREVEQQAQQQTEDQETPTKDKATQTEERRCTDS